MFGLSEMRRMNNEAVEESMQRLKHILQKFEVRKDESGEEVVVRKESNNSQIRMQA